MKITKSQLKQIIKEELGKNINEQESPKIVQILEKEVEETAAILRKIFNLNKQVGVYYEKAPEKNEGKARDVEQALIDQILKPFEDKEEELEALVDAAADLEPPDPEKFTKAMDAWSDHLITMPEELKKLFAAAQKNGVQMSKPFVKLIHDSIKQDLAAAQQNLKTAMQGLKAAKQGGIGTAAAHMRK